jgi:hypothetical protein
MVLGELTISCVRYQVQVSYSLVCSVEMKHEMCDSTTARHTLHILLPMVFGACNDPNKVNLILSLQLNELIGTYSAAPKPWSILQKMKYVLGCKSYMMPGVHRNLRFYATSSFILRQRLSSLWPTILRTKSGVKWFRLSLLTELHLEHRHCTLDAFRVPP